MSIEEMLFSCFDCKQVTPPPELYCAVHKCQVNPMFRICPDFEFAKLPNWFFEAITNGWKCVFSIDNSETAQNDLITTLNYAIKDVSDISIEVIASNLIYIKKEEKEE